MLRHVGPPGYHPVWGFFAGILPLLMFVVLIGLLVWAVLRLTGHAPARPDGQHWVGPPPVRGSDPAVEHARYRYARGEIGRDEFLRISHDLGAPVSAPPPPPPAAAAVEGPGG